MKPIDYTNDIIKYCPQFELHFNNLKLTEQDNKWHMEGNVWNHTLLVIESAIELSKNFENNNDKKILIWAAALHDIGKPYCSTIEDDHIRSYGHSKIGYHIINEILSKTDFPFNDKLMILNLVKYHGKPNWICKSNNSELDVIKISMDCRVDLLYNLSIADFLGRKSEDLEDQLINIEIFADIAKGLGCYNKPYVFTSDIVKFNSIVRKNMFYTDICFDNTKSKVIMLCGLPGTGKDTYISKNYKNIPVISLDDIRKKYKLKPDAVGKVISDAKELAKKYLRNGEDFIWNATNISKDIREGLITLFVTYNAYVTIEYLYTSYSNIIKRNSNREDSVPTKIIDKMLSKLDIPLSIECHEVRYIEV